MEYIHKTLFEVKIMHGYDTSGEESFFNIRPTRQCEKVLKNYGLLFRKKLNGFIVLYESYKKSGQLETLKPIEGSVGFCFTMKAESPYLTNFSELPLDKPSSVYYLHNLNDNPQSGRLLLSSSANTPGSCLGSKDQFIIMPQQFQYQIQSNQVSVQVGIIDQFGQTVVQETVLMVEPIVFYSVNLQFYPAGEYKLTLDGTEKLHFFADDRLRKESIFGIIQIFNHTLVPNAYRFIQGSQVQPQTYTISLKERAVLWKYMVGLKYRTDINLQKLKLTDTAVAQPIQFIKKNILTLSNGLNVVPFLSSTKIAFQRLKKKGIQLKAHDNSNNEIFKLENLPNASVHDLILDNNTGDYYSEIYVYI